jgi:hypothetical protein
VYCLRGGQKCHCVEMAIGFRREINALLRASRELIEMV